MSPATRRARFCSSSLWCGSGSESALAAGLIVTRIAGTTAVATLTVARRLGSESVARAAAPFLAAGPAAIWMCVTADAMFAAWAAALLALAATARRWWVQAVMGIAAGILFGWCLMLSHGLPLLVVLGVAILLIARKWRPLPWALAGVLVVVGAFAAAGFVW